jgi:hypothetical protein
MFAPAPAAHKPRHVQVGQTLGSEAALFPSRGAP